uniref:CDP-diacylglycerol--serine O-phosphatidyltransferase 1-like isoform X1 n=1 Tax=Tanacetum cinerariifolium TaxID=118510 RepID=A0A6L2LF03_TANCI|nr:CDP-diacylglycerol--serine O-phosphatidyltransferase 1-like isoform X1 [Tanacetum cinerariifolium]
MKLVNPDEDGTTRVETGDVKTWLDDEMNNERREVLWISQTTIEYPCYRTPSADIVTSVKRGIWAMISIFLAYWVLQAPSTFVGVDIVGRFGTFQQWLKYQSTKLA